MKSDTPNIYTFGRCMQEKCGGSVRQGMTFFLLARLPRAVQLQYLRGNFKSDAAVWDIAIKMGVAPEEWLGR